MVRPGRGELGDREGPAGERPGESIVSVATWLGPSSLKVTLDYYAHFMPGAGKRGLAAMDTWLV